METTTTMSTQVILMSHDPAWVSMFESEASLILDALGDNALAVHHIGSTAIHGIVAKPVIDILIEVRDLGLVDLRNTSMQAIGYEVMGEFGIPERRYFRKDNRVGQRTHHIHAFQQGNPQVKRHLAFRDFMQTHHCWANSYSELKLELAAQYPNSGRDYQAGKNAFIQSVDQLAAEWSRC
jgi:GrpB-like predicted nucleotidyltransferase (UPF0157 family)